MNTKIIINLRNTVNFACAVDDGDAMSAAPRSDLPSVAVRDGKDEGEHNSVTHTLNWIVENYNFDERNAHTLNWIVVHTSLQSCSFQGRRSCLRCWC